LRAPYAGLLAGAALSVKDAALSVPLVLLLLRLLLVLLSSSTLSLALYSLNGEQCTSTCGAAVIQQNVQVVSFSAEALAVLTRQAATLNSGYDHNELPCLTWERDTVLVHRGGGYLPARTDAASTALSTSGWHCLAARDVWALKRDESETSMLGVCQVLLC
jgi:hypothetical protein